MSFVSSAYIGVITIILCLIHFIRSTRQDTINRWMKYCAIVIFVSSLLYCIMIGLLRTNLILNTLNFKANGIICDLTYGFTYFFYIIAKLSIHLLFVQRLKVVFTDSIFAISDTTLNSLRVLSFLSALIFGTGVCLFLPKRQIITETFDISSCVGDIRLVPTYGNLSIIVFVLIDLFISAVLLWLYCYNLYKLSKSLNCHNKDMQYQVIRNMQSQLMKATILVTTSILSTWIFIFIADFVWSAVSWFMPLDTTINALTIYLMFGFSNHIYQMLCGLCIYCCNLCIPDPQKICDHQTICNHVQLELEAVPSISSNCNNTTKVSTNQTIN